MSLGAEKCFYVFFYKGICWSIPCLSFKSDRILFCWSLNCHFTFDTRSSIQHPLRVFFQWKNKMAEVYCCVVFFFLLILWYWHILPGLALLPHDSLTGVLILQQHTENGEQGDERVMFWRGEVKEKDVHSLKKKRRRAQEFESCVLSLVVQFSSQAGRAGGGGEPDRERGRERERERENGNVNETQREREGFLSHLSGLSPIATVA